ncbi:MAG: NADH-ubiquinone oxidoreductase-F iron-sulfur binding region domain-containing protein [Acidimicrobiales bacterium]
MEAPSGASLPRLLAEAPLESLPAHLAQWGPLPATSGWLIAEVHAAGLTGRGGSGFPTGRKLSAVAGRRGTIVVANATEGEPASSKDRTLLRIAPHLVIDGVVAAADAVGARDAILCIDRGAIRAAEAARRALAERRRAGIDPLDVQLELTPGRYLTGQETALVHWLNGGDAKPTLAPPRPSERGVLGRPTLVQNVETLAHLALIARFGSGWYRALGPEDDPGSTLVTLSGVLARPGVYEIPLGTPLSDVVGAAGGLTEQAAAVLLGGYYGRWVPATAMGIPLSRSALKQVGAWLGAGVVAVLGRDTCGLAEAARVTRWLAGQSAGQCGPCANGLPAIASALDAVVAGERSGDAERRLHRWTAMVARRGACGLPDGTGSFVTSTLQVFAAEIARHRQVGPCPPGRPVLPTPATTDGWR